MEFFFDLRKKKTFVQPFSQDILFSIWYSKECQFYFYQIFDAIYSKCCISKGCCIYCKKVLFTTEQRRRIIKISNLKAHI